MTGTLTEGVRVALAGAALMGAAPEAAGAAELQGSFPIVELRQYILHDGKRDVLINLFEREFVESQEALGMKVIGTFTDIDRPNRFVWIRGFSSMEARAEGLNAFYFGPVWRAHRDEANATMVDSDNVLLLHAPDRAAEFAFPAARPALGVDAPSGLVVATLYYLKDDPGGALPVFEGQVKPALEKAGIHPLAWFARETAPNNFPRLPVREGEKVLVWLAAFADIADHKAHIGAIEAAAKPLESSFARPPEVLRLKPTSRSLIRGLPPAAGVHDFDFLHGRWRVHHRLLKARGAGSSEWVDHEGTVDTRPLLGGLCNVEEHRISGRSSGVALRCYDRSARRWAIYWVGDGDGLLGPPVHGSFQGSAGLFEGDDTYEGKPIKVRFLWRKLSSSSARWEQSFSFDSGNSWETNWIMDFKRSK